MKRMTFFCFFEGTVVRLDLENGTYSKILHSSYHLENNSYYNLSACNTGCEEHFYLIAHDSSQQLYSANYPNTYNP